jgi:predicted phage baseplate assembly protein
VSSGAINQAFALFHASVVRDSVQVFTQDGAIDPTTGQPSFLSWTYFPKLAAANFYDRAFTVTVDEDNYTYAVFGDGVSGIIPATGAPVFVTYRYGVGASGNVGIGAVRSFVSGGVLTTKIASVTNTTAATGGTDAESVESMRNSIPRSLRTLERAVTLQDYAALTLHVAGVSKASASATVPTSVVVYIAPSGGSAPSADLIAACNAYFAGPPSRAMIGTSLSFVAPTYVPINITLSITVNAKHRRDIVQAAVATAIAQLYSFDNRNFAEILQKASVFHTVVDIPGVDYVDITLFSKTGSGTAGVTNPYRRTNEAGMQYAADMRDHIAENGFTMGPLEVTHGKRFGNERKDSTYLTQGHHRYWAAQQLGMTHVPVEGVNRTGVPVPGLLPERP